MAGTRRLRILLVDDEADMLLLLQAMLSNSHWEVLGKALALHELKIKVVEPRRAPFYLKDWLNYSAVVLMNVPAVPTN